MAKIMKFRYIFLLIICIAFSCLSKTIPKLPWWWRSANFPVTILICTTNEISIGRCFPRETFFSDFVVLIYRCVLYTYVYSLRCYANNFFFFLSETFQIIMSITCASGVIRHNKSLVVRKTYEPHSVSRKGIRFLMVFSRISTNRGNCQLRNFGEKT